jgi:hypothetical protein
MLDTILAYKAGIGWVLSLITSSLTVILFQLVFQFSPFVSVAVGVLAFVTTFVLWTRFLFVLEGVPPGGDRG